MDKPVKRVDLSMLTSEQRAALAQLVRDAQLVSAQRDDMITTAHTIFGQLVKAPRWGVAEGQEEQIPLQPWTVGHPQVNYVDHIERASDS